MIFSDSILNNLFNLPLISFIIGVILALAQSSSRIGNYFVCKFPTNLNKLLTVYILFAIGIKGGGPLIQDFISSTSFLIVLLSSLVGWGLIQPFISFYILRASTSIDSTTAAAIAASFGSISVMTFITAVAFLEQHQVGYRELVITTLAIMEIPAIISGIFLAKRHEQAHEHQPSVISKLLINALFNKAIIAIIIGLIAGGCFYANGLQSISQWLLFPFKSLLCLFLFGLGIQVGSQKQHFKAFSWSLAFFGLYMPLIGGCFGLILSYLLSLDIGTGMLIAVLAASASYIAVPAAMRIALPQAKETVYLTLSLGITFPFNVIIGIPLYYQMAVMFLR